MDGKLNILVITDSDLDGAGCALALKWLYENRTNQSSFKVIDLKGQDYGGLIKGLAPKFKQFDTVFITDLYIPDDCVELVDVENVFIIDHHQDHITVMDRYKTSRVLMKLYPSCAKLILDAFRGKYDDGILTEDRLKLIDIINDYDSYALKYKETLKYNIVFYNNYSPRAEKFVDSFYDGVREFTPHEKNAIILQFKKLKEQVATPEVYYGDIKGNKVISFFCTVAVNEMCHIMLTKHDADIAIAVMLDYGSVSFRRSPKCDIKLNILADKLCDGHGGGHEYAAGGKITDTFLKYTTTLKQC